MKIIYTISLIFTLLVSNRLGAQVPTGGVMMNASTGTTYIRIGKGTVSVIAVSDQTFTQGLRIAIGSDVVNSWDAQVKFPAVAGIEKDDVVLVAFYARTVSSANETGESVLNVIIENNTTYEKDLSLKINIGQDWKPYYAPVKCISTLSSSQVTFALHTGFPSQTFEIADVRFLNYKKNLTLQELPFSEITYAGQAADAAWRIPAQERINGIRKGVVDIVVRDQTGERIENAMISVEMVKHKFGFGTAIPANLFLSNTVFRNKVYELFNEIVFENDLKWPQFNPGATFNLTRAMDSLKYHQIAIRGHNVIWPSWRNTPAFLQALKTNPTALRNAIDKHIDEVTQFTKGRLNDWDVINEPYSEKDVMDVLGNEAMADWFKRVRQNDRNVKLYLNDYSIINGGGSDIAKQNSYYNLVKYIDEMGGELDGIGIQGHFGSELTSITKVYSIVDRFAELGKEIKITEHDIDITQREVQAEYTRDLLTILFSHPAVKSFLVWGFWEKSHWKPDGAFYNADWTIRPHGAMYKELVFNQWWTKKTDLITDSLGNALLDGFLGTYKYTLKVGDTERSGTFTIDHSHQSGIKNSVILSLDDAIPEQVLITANKPFMLCQGESITLSAPAGNGLNYKWYNGAKELPDLTESITTSLAGLYSVIVFKDTVEISSAPFEVIVNPIPESIITSSGNLSFCPGGSVQLSTVLSINNTYNWMEGNTKIDGSVGSVTVDKTGSYRVITNARGCSSESDPVNVQVYSSSSEECITALDKNELLYQVYPNPFKSSFTIASSATWGKTARAELYNSQGKLVQSFALHPSQKELEVFVGTPGFYTLKLTTNTGIKSLKIACR